MIGLTTRLSYIGQTTQLSYIDQMTQHGFIDPMTQQFFFCSITQHHCKKSSPMTLYEYPMLSCPTPFHLSTLYNYAQKIWIKLISSSLLEFYIRTMFVILQSFDIISENDFPQCKL